MKTGFVLMVICSSSALLLWEDAKTKCSQQTDYIYVPTQGKKQLRGFQCEIMVKG